MRSLPTDSGNASSGSRSNTYDQPSAWLCDSAALTTVQANNTSEAHPNRSRPAIDRLHTHSAPLEIFITTGAASMGEKNNEQKNTVHSTNTTRSFMDRKDKPTFEACTRGP